MAERAAVVARPAASPDQLARYSKAIAQWLVALEGNEGCSVCGMGPHVELCPVPALRSAQERLAFMSAVPVTTETRTRGTSS